MFLRTSRYQAHFHSHRVPLFRQSAVHTTACTSMEHGCQLSPTCICCRCAFVCQQICTQSMQAMVQAEQKKQGGQSLCV